jgi:hypothetical protein
VAGVKQSGIKTDPDKVRDWNERSRTPLKTDPDKALKRSAPLRAVSERDAEGREGQRSSTLRRTGFPRAHDHADAADVAAIAALRDGQPKPKAKPKPKGPPTTIREACSQEFTPFKAARPARTQVCARCPQARPRTAASWHHWLPQEHLRVMMRGLAQAGGWTPTQTQRRLRRWLRAGENLTPMCPSCHMDGEHSTRGAQGTQGERLSGFARDELPASAWEFARELDDELEAAGRPREATARLYRNYGL